MSAKQSNEQTPGSLVDVDQSLLERCQRLIEAGETVEAVKTYRAATGCGLATAQRALGLRL
ncbi:hypothetical protein [Pseudomonas nitroreducens]|uniref:50S ribosomal protein L7/L12 n=1 Tax=Pseudomonas nitroreducens TaxID=46680 RepID=A0A6G6J6U3_PSENT|nr:hypothetical protein [Pseudomonas nitroreducens]QIE91136.1 hypothetical protein G5B91_32790 [Pseudomonas nitroreducens]